MEWHKIDGSDLGDTYVMEVGKGVIVRFSDFSSNGHSSSLAQTMCLVPDCRLIVGGCSERAKIVSRTETR